MNPGEEKRFDGLLKNKFNEFEAAPNAAVWQAVSQTLPPAKPGMLQRALPFGLGTAFGIMVSLGFVSGYEHFTGNSLGGNPASLTVLTAANQPETTAAPALATTPAPGTTGSATVTGSTRPSGSGNANSVTENALAMANTETNSQSVSDHSTSYSRRRIVTTEYQHNRYTTSETANYQAAAQRRNRQNQAIETALRTITTPVSSATPVSGTQAEMPKAPVNTIAQTPVNATPSAWLTGHELDTAIAKVLTADAKLGTNKAELKELLKAQGTVLAVLQNRNDSLLLALKDSELDSTIAKVRINRPRRHSGSIKPPVGWPSPSEWAITANYEANPQWGGITMAHTNAKATENVRLSRTISVGVKHRVNQQLSLSGGLGVVLVESEMNYSRKQEITDKDPNTGQIIATHTIDQNQFLRPSYSFVTMPLAMHYRFGGYGHLGIGFSAGVQTNLYRGGTTAVFQNNQYMLTKASAKEGPFRQLSVAATGGLDFSYRVAPRLTVQGGPTLRYWAISPYKQADAGFKFLPGLQFGVSWDL